MVTKEQAMTEKHFHYGNCKRTVGPSGGVTVKIEQWRANGACQTWKTWPAKFRLPIKHGLRGHDYLTQNSAELFHTEWDCPLGQQ